MNTSETIQAITSSISAVGVIVGFWFAVRQISLVATQLKAEKRSQQAQTLLLFDQMLDRHDAIHRKLRPGGESP